MELLNTEKKNIIQQTYSSNNSNNNKDKKKKNRNNDNQIGRTMCLLLRHQAKEFNLDMDKLGFVKINDLFKCKPLIKFKLTRERLDEIVKEDEKGRYEIKDDLIRCVQGHSIKINPEDTLEALTINDIFDFPVVVHGTYYEGWKFIKETGLNRMTRTCVHFAIGYINDKDVISGMRTSCEVYVEINMLTVFFNDIKLYKSKNNVILCPGKEDGAIPSKYFKIVTDKNKECLFNPRYLVS